MEHIYVKDVISCKAIYRELSFIYNDRSFVYKLISTDAWEEGFLVDLNSEGNQLDQSSFKRLEERVNQLDLSLITESKIEILL